MKKVILLVFMLVLCTAIFAMMPASAKGADAEKGADVEKTKPASSNSVNDENEARVIKVDESSDTPVSVSAGSVKNEDVSKSGRGAVVEIKKGDRTINVSGTNEGKVTISVSTPSGVVISVNASESVEVKKGEIYFVNMTKAVVLPNDIISPQAKNISATLERERDMYKYRIRAENTKGEPVIAIKESYKAVVPYDAKRVYVNDTIVEYTDVDAPVSVQVRERDRTRTMLIKQEGTHSIIEDGETRATVRAEIEFENGEMRMNGTKVKMLPATAAARAFEVTGAMVKDMELNRINERAVYKMNLTKQYKLLWFIPVNVTVPTEVSAEDGKVISVQQPWWAFLSSDTIALKEGDSLQ